MSVHAGVCAYKGQSEVDGGVFTNHSPLDLFFEMGSLANCGAQKLARLASNKLQGSSCFCLPSIEACIAQNLNSGSHDSENFLLAKTGEILPDTCKLTDPQTTSSPSSL